MTDTQMLLMAGVIYIAPHVERTTAKIIALLLFGVATVKGLLT